MNTLRCRRLLIASRSYHSSVVLADLACPTPGSVADDDYSGQRHRATQPADPKRAPCITIDKSPLVSDRAPHPTDVSRANRGFVERSTTAWVWTIVRNSEAGSVGELSSEWTFNFAKPDFRSKGIR